MTITLKGVFSLTKLRKVYASEEKFKELKQKYLNIYNPFKTFAQQLTDEAGKAIKRSNKADSYANALIKLIVLYEEIYSETISFDELDTPIGISKLEKISSLNEFEKFNANGSHFMSATIACFKKYIDSKNADAELEKDDDLNKSLQNPNLQESIDYTIESPKRPKTKPEKVSFGNRKVYPRSINEAMISKRNSNWTCELNSNHKTFNSSFDDHNFVEAHHLIPMSVQDNYSNSLDFADNIVALCPNCHRLIHHANSTTKKDAVAKLYEKRKDFYFLHGISINLETLLSYYGIN